MTENAILDAAAKALADLGLRAEVTQRNAHLAHDERFDGIIEIGYGDWTEARIVEIKRTITPATIGAVQANLTHQKMMWEEKPILVTRYVTPPLADRLRDLNVEFCDCAGNAYITTRNTLIWVRGRRNRALMRDPKPTGRAFGPGGLRVLFALLCNPERIAENYRQLARDAAVAHGTVGWVIADLKDRGFIVDTRHPNRRRKLTQIERLIPMWVEAYARTLRQKLVLARFRTDDMRGLTTAPKLMPGMLIGGEIAAARITKYLKPATATFWVDKIEPRFIIENKLILDEKGPVQLMRKFWNFPPDTPELAPNLLTYADLLAIGDARTIETAQLMQAQILDRPQHKD